MQTTLDPTDDELLARIVQAEASAFETLYDRHSRMAFGLAYRLLDDAGAAEEVVQEAFLSVWRQAHSYGRERGSVRAWLLSIVHHRAIDRMRSRKSRESRQEPLDEATLPPDRTDTWQEVQTTIVGEQVRAALAQLPPDQQASVKLAYFGGMTHDEIARHLGLPLGTVKGRLRLGLQKMRQVLEERGMGGSQ